jgi:predicted esterase
MKLFPWPVLCSLLLFPASARAQPERYELAQRLKAFELAWELKKPEGERRKRVSEPLGRAVTAFFRLRLGEAARCLDEARFALLSQQPPSEVERWAAALSLQPESRLLDREAKVLEMELRAFYPSKVERPAGISIRLSLVDQAEKAVGKSLEVPITELPLKTALAVDSLPEGDYGVVATITVGQATVTTLRFKFSRVSQPAERLKKIAAALEQTQQRTVASETIRAHHTLLTALWEKQTLETDYPAARLLAEAESFLEIIRTGNETVLKNRAGQHWMTFPTGSSRTPVRLFAPKDIATTPVPLVIALHGAGGSENMFFEGYGAGAIVKECEKRGWLLVAPRGNGIFGPSLPIRELIDELAKLYPVDRKRVFLVGHSLGAATAIATAVAMPEQVSAVAALAGGGRIAKMEAVKAIPFFIACGDQDFARSQSRSLAKSLGATGGPAVTFKEYPDIEHLAIVQVALPDVFAFLDAVSNKK